MRDFEQLRGSLYMLQSERKLLKNDLAPPVREERHWASSFVGKKQALSQSSASKEIERIGVQTSTL